MQDGILNNFVFPEGGAELIAAASKRNAQNLGVGVDILCSGNDDGTSYRFYSFEEYQATLSEETDLPMFKSIDLIQWFVDKSLKPSERVDQLPPELLRFNREGECIGGKYKASYEAYKLGKSQPGYSLRSWGQLTDAEVATLEATHCYTVEQFASIPSARITQKYPKAFQEAHAKAERFLAGRDSREQLKKQDSVIESLVKERDEAARKIAELQTQMASLMAIKSEEPEKRKPGRPKKEIIEGE